MNMKNVVRSNLNALKSDNRLVREAAVELLTAAVEERQPSHYTRYVMLDDGTFMSGEAYILYVPDGEAINSEEDARNIIDNHPLGKSMVYKLTKVIEDPLVIVGIRAFEAAR